MTPVWRAPCLRFASGSWPASGRSYLMLYACQMLDTYIYPGDKVWVFVGHGNVFRSTFLGHDPTEKHSNQVNTKGTLSCGKDPWKCCFLIMSTNMSICNSNSLISPGQISSVSWNLWYRVRWDYQYVKFLLWRLWSLHCWSWQGYQKSYSKFAFHPNCFYFP